ncbi:MAG TPA: hypothetical protein VMX75_03570 [Spirochaetia bacterium]|nr:hypothetical protein [Spirochaetia bacterium]
MEEIIDDILKAEQRAESTLEEARKKEADMRRALESEISSMLEEAHTRAQKIIEERVSLAKREAQEMYEEGVKKAEGQRKNLLEKNKGQLENVVEEIVGYIVTPEYRRK